MRYLYGFLAFLLFWVCVPSARGAIDPEIEKNFHAALSENPRYRAQQTRIRALLDAEKKQAYRFAASQPDLKALLDEYYPLFEALCASGMNPAAAPKLDMAKIRRFGELNQACRKKLWQDPACLAAGLDIQIGNLELLCIRQQIAADIADPRVQRYRAAFAAEQVAMMSRSLDKLPQADCAGSREYRVARAVAESYKKEPVKYKWQMVHANAILLQRIQALAEADPAVAAAAARRDLYSTENALQRERINRQNPQLYADAMQLNMNYAELDPAQRKKCESAAQQLQRLCAADPECKRLQAAYNKAAADFQAKLNDFIRTSSAPAAVDYRAIQALIAAER